MNDILPPKKPLSPPTPPQAPALPSPALSPSTPPPAAPPSSLVLTKKKRSIKKIILWICLGLFILLVILPLAAYGWYKVQLGPLKPGDTSKISITIAEGSSPARIGQDLEQKKVIRSHLAFEIYTREAGLQAKLQAGPYRLSPGESTEQIAAHIASGKIDEFKVTFLPGATLAENRQTLLKAGYSASEVDAALKKTYDHPLFVDKPASSDLEGYIYGETYSFASDTTVEQVLKRTFDEYWQAIEQNHLVEGIKAHRLSLYEGITLASIIQREVAHPADQKQVAQVFFSRLAQGILLGSDVTYQYAAKKLGVPASPLLDSAYNTRKYAGLPPGPIATPGLSALMAVANPAPGDYLYFLSGDDGVTYFARTDSEHQANIQAHCQTKCQLP